MVCEKCGGRLNAAGACTICGYDREKSNAEFAVVHEKKLHERSLRLKIYTWINVIVGALYILIALLVPVKGIIKVIIIIPLLAQIAVCISLFLYKKWAFYLIVVLMVFNILLEGIISKSIVYILVQGVVSLGLTFWFVEKDWHKFT